MTISDTSLRNSVYLEIKNLLSSAGLQYYDNTDTAVTGVTITAAYIDDDRTFPQVVINNSNIAKSDFTFDKSALNTIQIMIDIYTKKAKNLDYITDQIDNISGLKSIQGMNLIAWDETKAYSPVNDNKIHLKSITLTYKRR